MGTFSIWHWLIVLAVVLILFGGGGKISKLMGDFGKGLKSFKKNMQEGEGGEPPPEGGEPKKTIDAQSGQPTPGASTSQTTNTPGGTPPRS